MDDGEVDLGSTTTGKTELDFTPEQLAAQRLGLDVLGSIQPNQEMQIRRGLALLQPEGAGVAQGARESVAEPIRRATGLVQRNIGMGLMAAGLPPTSSASILENLRNIDRETLNASRAQIIERLLSGSPIQLFRPDLRSFLVDPDKATQISKTSQGSGATALQIGGTVVGIGAAVAAAIIA